MKKIFIMFLSVLTALSVTACSLSGSDNNGISSYKDEISNTYDIPQNDDREYDIALITDSEGIESEKNLNLWKSIIAYGDTNCKTYKYYPESQDETAVYLIDKAVANNAKIVILPDSKYKNTLTEIQSFYPYINFIILDTQSDEVFAENVHCVKFKEEQAGYLAGYLSVLDGNQSLGFIGDGDNEKNMRYLYGMVQGADDATQKLRLHGITVQYKFIEDNAEKAKKLSKAFYDDGVDVIFTCAENIAKGAAQSAESAEKKIICGGSVFEDTENVSLAYVEYEIVRAVDYTINSGFDSYLDWVGESENKDLNLGLENDCIEISVDKSMWKFKNVSAADYNDIVNKIINGDVEISDNTESKPPIAAVVYSEFVTYDDDDESEND